MHVVFDAKPVEAKSLRELTVERLRFVLRRLYHFVNTARVRFSDVNGPRGGVDKHAHIQLNLLSNGTVVVEARAETWRTALETALQRAIGQVLRTLKQSRRPQRKSIKNLVSISH
ncbi:MAG: HPF/RaiA family ribosome-associated protein [Hylemonella sp.]|nr:HPF/RaiA family ribosome-associated protein [Hylemonella sp.]